MIEFTLYALAALLLGAFGFVVWPPLALLVGAAACLTAGLLIDWEAPRGKPTRTPSG